MSMDPPVVGRYLGAGFEYGGMWGERKPDAEQVAAAFAEFAEAAERLGQDWLDFEIKQAGPYTPGTWYWYGRSVPHTSES